ncbi:MAG: hypothetical protein J0M12_13990 [Deltaproteobacteria bacterium]|nr:hypothetical protein [Deltaproteobacteria bacterium]
MPLCGTFKSQLRFWASHALFCAAPSFLWALMIGFSSLTAISAMCCGIAVWVCLYAAASSSAWAMRRLPGTLLGRAIQLGAKARSVLAIVSICVALVPGLGMVGAMFFYSDLYAGFISIQASSFMLNQPSPHYSTMEQSFGFLYTFLTTLVQGFLLSFTLIAVVLCCLLFLFCKQRFSAPRTQK